MTIERYTPELKQLWDQCVAASRNGTFLHKRDYMDYHADRFADHSLIARDDKGRIVAVLPAHGCGTDLCSHRGLTFAGWLMTPRADAPAMVQIWDETIAYARAEGFKAIIYKPVPHIYHIYPAEEDLYPLVCHGARLEGMLLSSVIDNSNPLSFDMSCRQSVRKAQASGVVIAEERDFKPFWHMLEDLLRERYNSQPVHSIDEIELLAGRFPANIRLLTARCGEELLGGVVVYVSEMAVHSQYTATSAVGRDMRVLPLLYRHLIDTFADRRYFDFGTSNEDGGKVLNHGLIRQKIGFGARGIAYYSYHLDL